MRQEGIMHGHSAYNFLCRSYRGRFISTGLCPELRLYPQLICWSAMTFIHHYFHNLSEVSRSIFQLWGVTFHAIAARWILYCPAAFAVSSALLKQWQDLVRLLGFYTPFPLKEKAQEWCMTTPTTKQWKTGPIFYWMFHNDEKHKSHLSPADIKSHLPLHFQKAASSKARSYFNH